jgi:signal transduction histidine kinase
LQIIRQQIDRMHEDARSILNYAQPVQKPSQLVHVADLVSQVLGLADKQLKQCGMKVIKDFEEVPPILAAPDSLMQVFLNMVINAVESSRKFESVLDITVKSDKGHVCASFTTNGPTIPEKDLPYIFDPFFTTKLGGSGLGLWISRNLVEQYQGSLKASNLADGEGVIFTVMFPGVVEGAAIQG